MDPALLIRNWPAGVVSDFPICGPGLKNWARNSMFELRRVAAPASSFSYRSIDERWSITLAAEILRRLRWRQRELLASQL
jgi:hypothetical protein